MDKHDVLQRIDWNDHEDNEIFTYIETRDYVRQYMDRFLARGCSIRQCVNGTFYYHYEEEMNANGMEKLVCMIAGLLFQIKHGEVDPDQAYGTNWDIRDFETGNYDDLMSEEDLIEIKKDIKIIKDYLEEHQELIK